MSTNFGNIRTSNGIRVYKNCTRLNIRQVISFSVHI